MNSLKVYSVRITTVLEETKLRTCRRSKIKVLQEGLVSTEEHGESKKRVEIGVIFTVKTVISIKYVLTLTLAVSRLKLISRCTRTPHTDTLTDRTVHQKYCQYCQHNRHWCNSCYVKDSVVVFVMLSVFTLFYNTNVLNLSFRSLK